MGEEVVDDDYLVMPTDMHGEKELQDHAAFLEGVHSATLKQAIDCLMAMFVWESSPQGHGYWSLVYQELLNVQKAREKYDGTV